MNNSPKSTFETKKKPSAQGYSMPAEWAKHEATWLAWPHNLETWPGNRLASVEEVYLQMLEALLPNEKVNLLLPDEKSAENVQIRLQSRQVTSTHLNTHIIPTVDAWIRDYGPTFLKGESGSKRWCKWVFNA